MSEHVDTMSEAEFLRQVADELVAAIRHGDKVIQQSIARLHRMADTQDRMTDVLAKGEGAGWSPGRMFGGDGPSPTR